MIIKVRLIADRALIAGILVKNGYSVQQVKVAKASGKGNDICLSAEEPEEMISSAERGED